MQPRGVRYATAAAAASCQASEGDRPCRKLPPEAFDFDDPEEEDVEMSFLQLQLNLEPAAPEAAATPKVAPATEAVATPPASPSSVAVAEATRTAAPSLAAEPVATPTVAGNADAGADADRVLLLAETITELKVASKSESDGEIQYTLGGGSVAGAFREAEFAVVGNADQWWRFKFVVGISLSLIALTVSYIYYRCHCEEQEALQLVEGEEDAARTAQQEKKLEQEKKLGIPATVSEGEEDADDEVCEQDNKFLLYEKDDTDEEDQPMGAAVTSKRAQDLQIANKVVWGDPSVGTADYQDKQNQEIRNEWREELCFVKTGSESGINQGQQSSGRSDKLSCRSTAASEEEARPDLSSEEATPDHSVEPHSLQSRFEAVAKDFYRMVAAKEILLPQDTMLEIYGLYKQATCGDCTSSRPWAMDVKGQAKWDAWHTRRGGGAADAMQDYLEVVRFALHIAERPDEGGERDLAEAAGAVV